MNNLTHLNEAGKANMVDVGEKKQQIREAQAEGIILLSENTIKLISDNLMKKGDVLTVAEIAGIQAAKKTWDLIPLCHTIMLTKVNVKAQIIETGVKINSIVKCVGQTGVEMEALTAVSVGLLTIYDMCKAVDKNMIISEIKLLQKTKIDL